MVVPTDQTLTPAGHQVEFAGRPNAVAFSPTDAKAAFLIAGAKPITVVDLATGTVAPQFDPGDTSASFDGLVHARDGRHLYASLSSGKILSIPSIDRRWSVQGEANGTASQQPRRGRAPRLMPTARTADGYRSRGRQAHGP